MFGSLRPPAELPKVALLAGMIREQLGDLVLAEYAAPSTDPGRRVIDIPGT